MHMMDSSFNNINNRLTALFGQESEIELLDGEVLQGVPMEITFPRAVKAHLLFEAAHGEYLCLDLNEIGSVRPFDESSFRSSPLWA